MGVVDALVHLVEHVVGDREVQLLQDLLALRVVDERLRPVLLDVVLVEEVAEHVQVHPALAEPPDLLELEAVL